MQISYYQHTELTKFIVNPRKSFVSKGKCTIYAKHQIIVVNTVLNNYVHPSTLYDPTNILTLQFQPCPSMHQPEMKSTVTDKKEILFTAQMKGIAY